MKTKWILAAFLLICASSAQAKPMHVTAMHQTALQTTCSATYEHATYTLDCTATRRVEVGKDYEVVYLKSMPGFGTYMKVIVPTHPDGMIFQVLATSEGSR